MRLPIGSTDVTPSGGTITLIGRRGEGWEPIVADPIPVAEAIELCRAEADVRDRTGTVLVVDDGTSERFPFGQEITWHYSRSIDTARVVADDADSLVAWIPSGAAGLAAVGIDDRRAREVPIEQRFTLPWKMAERSWTGHGVLRVAPVGMPWSVWYFWSGEGQFDGWYVNLELPHSRPVTGEDRTHSSDLVLDLWVDAGRDGTQDVWLKDADELDAAVAQGRYTPEQAHAVRSIGEHAVRTMIEPLSAPMSQPWHVWLPPEELDRPLLLPDTEIVRRTRELTG